jgi:hypothetical protein
MKPVIQVLLFSINQQVIIGSFDPKKEKLDIIANGNNRNSFVFVALID